MFKLERTHVIKTVFFLFIFLVKLNLTLKSQKQNDSLLVNQSHLILSGYAEMYYSYDLGKPVNGIRPGFLYNHNLHHQPAFNIVFVKASYEGKTIRSNIALMEGSYRQYNLSHEPKNLSYIFEANAGVKLSKHRNLWFDAGVFPSHIGFESAVGADCYNLTRSIVAENSPYYESGLRLSYSSQNKRLFLSTLLLSGWQRILPRADNLIPSLGWQMNYQFLPELNFNYSGFFGNIHNRENPYWRHYHNMYAVLKIKQFAVITGLDIGFQRNLDLNGAELKSGIWYTPVLILKYDLSEKIHTAFRAEYFADPKAFVTESFSSQGLNSLGISSNIDFEWNEYLMLRMETRMFKDKNKVFMNQKIAATNNTFFTTAFIVKF